MEFTHSLLGLALAASVPAFLGDLSAADIGVVNFRGGLPNFAKSLPKNSSSGDRARITYFGGGSINGVGASTGGKACSAQLTRMFKKAFPKRHLVEYKKGLLRTNSWLGAFRTETEVVRHYIPLKLVVIEFAADDYGMPEMRLKAALEGIVRQVRKQHKYAEILFLYSLRKEYMADFAQGRVPDVIQWHDQVAAHYDLPSVNLAKFVADKIAAHELTFEDFFKDGLHPTDKGHALYSAAIQPLVNQCKASQPPAELIAHTLPKPLTPQPLEQARLVSYEKGELEKGWLGWQESPIELFFHVARCNDPGPVLALRFKGAAIGYFDVLGPNSGDFEFAIDDGQWQFKRNFDEYAKAGYRPHAGLLAEGLDPNQEHVVKIRVAAKPPDGSQGRWGRIAQFLVDGQVIFDDPNRGKSTLERIDGIWSKMEPVTYIPPPEHWQFLPNTMKKLRQGPELRIVMLGDSIVNDTAHSHYEHLLMRSSGPWRSFFMVLGRNCQCSGGGI